MGGPLWPQKQGGHRLLVEPVAMRRKLVQDLTQVPTQDRPPTNRRGSETTGYPCASNTSLSRWKSASHCFFAWLAKSGPATLNSPPASTW